MEKDNYTYDRKERFKRRKERYLKILILLRDEPLSRKEIRIRLVKEGFGICENSLIKDYLNKMIEYRQIGSLDKSFDHKDYKWIFKIIYGKKWDMKQNFYYFLTPRTKDLYDELYNLIDNLNNKDKCMQIINELTRIFRTLEILSKFKTMRFFNDTIVKRVLKKEKKRPTQENIQKEKDRVCKAILDCSNTPIKVPITLSYDVKVINGKEYIILGKKKVELQKLLDFVALPRSYMDHIMVWVSYHREVGEKEAKPEVISEVLVRKMIELFFAIEDS